MLPEEATLLSWGSGPQASVLIIICYPLACGLHTWFDCYGAVELVGEEIHRIYNRAGTKVTAPNVSRASATGIGETISC